MVLVRLCRIVSFYRMMIISFLINLPFFLLICLCLMPCKLVMSKPFRQCRTPQLPLRMPRLRLTRAWRMCCWSRMMSQWRREVLLYRRVPRLRLTLVQLLSFRPCLLASLRTQLDRAPLSSRPLLIIFRLRKRLVLLLALTGQRMLRVGCRHLLVFRAQRPRVVCRHLFFRRLWRRMLYLLLRRLPSAICRPLSGLLPMAFRCTAPPPGWCRVSSICLRFRSVFVCSPSACRTRCPTWLLSTIWLAFSRLWASLRQQVLFYRLTIPWRGWSTSRIGCQRFFRTRLCRLFGLVPAGRVFIRRHVL